MILGGIFASIRGGMVAAWESAESAGTLTRRAEGFPERGVYELLRDADSVTNAGILGGYTQPQTSHLDVIGSVSEHPLLEADDIFRVAQILDRDYRICVMDTGNVLRSSAFGASLALADVLVIPVVWSGVDTAFAALDLIEKLESSGNAHWQALAQNAIIVTSHDGRPESKETMERISSALRACTHRAIFDVPFDPHIALGEQITLSALSRESMWTWTTCSAEVIRTLQDMVQ